MEMHRALVDRLKAVAVRQRLTVPTTFERIHGKQYPAKPFGTQLKDRIAAILTDLRKERASAHA
jgi:hypothetical protein